MIQTQFEHEHIVNNIANVNTAGFKKDYAYVQKELQYDFANDQLRASQDGFLAKTDQVYTHFEQGKIIPTGNIFDVAIHGEGFFSVNTENGLKYTRNGQFSLDNGGRLVDNTGNPVQGDAGDIVIDGNEVFINDRGEIFVDGELVDSLQVVNITDKQKLTKQGDSLYQAGEDAEIAPAEEYVIKQGSYEGSNVNTVTEMVKMIDLQRTYESNSKVLTTLDETLRKLVNDVAKVN